MGNRRQIPKEWEPCRRCKGTGKEPDLYSFGQYVRTIRKRKKLSIKEVAELADISLGYLNRIEMGTQECKWNTPCTKRVLDVLEIPQKELNV